MQSINLWNIKNEFLQKNSWERQESNLGLHVEMRERYLCACLIEEHVIYLCSFLSAPPSTTIYSHLGIQPTTTLSDLDLVVYIKTKSGVE